MAEAISTPRITSAYLDSFTGKTVRMIGKVVQLRGEQAIIDSEGNVTIHLNRVSYGDLLPFLAVQQQALLLEPSQLLFNLAWTIAALVLLRLETSAFE
jgi:hypothetical protein